MIKEVGRLNIDDYKVLDAHVEKIFRSLDKDKEELAVKQFMSWEIRLTTSFAKNLANALRVFRRSNLDKICVIS